MVDSKGNETKSKMKHPSFFTSVGKDEGRFIFYKCLPRTSKQHKPYLVLSRSNQSKCTLLDGSDRVSIKRITNHFSSQLAQFSATPCL